MQARISGTRWVIVIICLAVLAGCASAGHIIRDEHTYRFNRSDIVQEGKHYRIWVWSYHWNLFDYFGTSPIGIQILLPVILQESTRIEVGKYCAFWIRRDWSLVGAANDDLWLPVQSGYVFVNQWHPETAHVSGQFEVITDLGPMRGEFVVSPETLSKNIIR